MKKTICYWIVCGWIVAGGTSAAQESVRKTELTLKEAVLLAQARSVEATVALNELKKAYWEYRTYRADQLPEVLFEGTLPAYTNQYNQLQQPDGTYNYVQSNVLGMKGKLSVTQNVPLTGGKISLTSSLDYTRQLGRGAYNEFMSIPVGVTFVQPIFGVNDLKWRRRIEPIRYQEAKAAYIERVENVTLTTIDHFFNLLLARQNVEIARQNLANADKLYEIAIAKRKIGHISETELLQLKQSSLQAKGKLTEMRSQLNARMFALRSFLALDEDLVIEPVLPPSIPGVRMDYGEVLEKALENNSFAKNILRRRLEADYEVATAKGNRRSIDLFASVGYTGQDHLLGSAYRHLNNNRLVEMGVVIPLLDWGKRKGKVKMAESNREVVISQTRQEEMDFNQNIYLLVENFNNQAEQLELATEVDSLAQKRYRTSVETFMIGKIDILDLNDAQQSKDEARQKHIRELYDYWLYFYNIRSLTLFDFLQGRTLDADFEVLVRE